MRAGRAFAAGRFQAPFKPFVPGSSCIFTRDNSGSPRKVSQDFAKRIANQLSYSNTLYSYDGSPAPSFFGYSGLGYGGNSKGFQTVANIQNFTPSIFVVPAGHPTEKVTYVNSKGEAQAEGFGNNLQAAFNAVPVPLLANVPAGVLTAGGSDKEIIIWQPSTGKMWEMFRLEGTTGAWTFQYGALIGPGSTHGFNGAVDEWNGVFGAAEGGQVYGAVASGLGMAGGLLTHQDIIEVLRGGSIGHALGIAAEVTENAHVGPATRNDAFANPKHFEVDGTTPNPAFGTVDQVPEGSWFCFPAASTPAEWGITKPLEVALYEAIRKYGMFVLDSSGTCAFYIESPVSLGSPYAYAKVNPFAGASGVWSGYSYANGIVPASWADPTLTPPAESFSGTTSVWAKMPWQTLEVLEPFSS